MRKLGDNIDALIASMAGDSEQARIQYRAHQVRNRYRLAIESVYREKAAIFLAHTNNVYIMKRDGVQTLIVYVDESIFAAELNAQRELIRLKLLELFGEEVERFDIHISRGSYRARHPYVDEEQTEEEKVSPEPLDGAERAEVRSVSRTVEDLNVRKSFEKAMTADLALKKAEKRKLN